MRLQPLPIDDLMPELMRAVAEHPFVVLEAPPGAGKSTRVPPALLELNEIKGEIWVLEPRRIAARSLAERIAYERGQRVGQDVGYRVRFDSKVGKNTRIVVVTEGILTRRFLHDPLLEGIGAIVLDEFHERSIHTDLCLGFSRILHEVRDDLRVLVMSATLDGNAISTFLDNAPLLRANVAPFPVDVHHAPHDAKQKRSHLSQRAVRAVNSILARDDDDEGDILVFLPGASDIHRTERELSSRRDVEVFPLYGSMNKKEQDLVFQTRAQRASGKRRVVLATNIAETSLTLPDVTTVLDCGVRKRMSFDPKQGSDVLKTVSISKQSAIQRRGRAGRTQKGRAFCLYTEREEAQFVDADPPEITSVDPASALLMLAQFSPGSPLDVPLLNAPSPARVERASSLLSDLGLLKAGTLTPLGEAASALPVHPRMASILIEAKKQKVARRACLLCATLSESPRDPRPLSELADSIEHGRRDAFDNVRRVAQQLERSVKAPDFDEGSLSDGEIMLPGFIDRLCRRAPGDKSAKQRDGRRVVWPQIEHDDAEFFVALSYAPVQRRDQVEAEVSRGVTLTLAQLRARFPSTSAVEIEFENDRAVGVKRERVLDFVIEEKWNVAIPKAQKREVLFAQCMREGEGLFSLSDEHAAFFERLAFAQDRAPELELPRMDSESRARRLRGIIENASSIHDVRKYNIYAHVLGEMSFAVRASFDERFPEKFRTETGAAIGIDYGAAKSAPHLPVWGARIQELFGRKSHPSVDSGRVPLLLHLLAPNRRPAQVTQDLPGFWAGSYEAVRKDLRARYPKHSWPDDPAEAKAEHRPKRKKPRT